MTSFGYSGIDHNNKEQEKKVGLSTTWPPASESCVSCFKIYSLLNFQISRRARRRRIERIDFKEDPFQR